MKHILFITMLVAIALPACAHERHSDRDQVSVTGVGEIKAEPDQATLRLSIKALGKDLASAKRDADARYQSVLDVIKQAGIADAQVKVVHLSMQPRYEWSSNKQQYKGEEVSRSLSVIINDLQKVSPLMQAMVENGLSTMDGLSTGFQNRSALLQQALGAATEDAKDKAAFLAQQFDRNLGQAILISEHNSGGPIQQQQDMHMSKQSGISEAYAAPQEMFGTQTISATVNASFKLN
ncbi:MAG: hypothetical protein ACI9FR_002879 [Cryomorphaceae bacterium]|jgi:uncharacterized protein YggE